MTLLNGLLLVAKLTGDGGCGALKLHIDTQIAEVKRMWVASDVAGLDWATFCWTTVGEAASTGNW